MTGRASCISVTVDYCKELKSLHYVRLSTELVTVNFSLALSASHLVTYADGGCVPKSFLANLNTAIYTKHAYCNAATE